jgi:outer membrane protein assembly factor BamB
LATGRRVWYAKLAGEPGIQHHGTFGSSPVLAGDIVVMRFGHWIYGLKTSDGTQVWEGRESEQWYRIRSTEHYTPLVVTIDKTAVVVTSSGQFIRAADGKMLADLDLMAAISGEMVAMPVLDHGAIYFSVDIRTGPEFRLIGKPKDAKVVWKAHLLAVKLPDRISGDTLQTSILWKTETPNAATWTTPVVFNGLLYTRDLNNEWLRVFDIRDGSLVYEKDLDWLGRTLTLNPFVVAGGNLYITSAKVDRTIVIKTGREYIEVARNVRGIKKQALHGWEGGFGLLYGECPVFSGTRMYWREGRMMYCFDKNAPTKPAVPGVEGKVSK